MTEDLEQLFKSLKLKRVLDTYDGQLRTAEKEDVGVFGTSGRKVRLSTWIIWVA